MFSSTFLVVISALNTLGISEFNSTSSDLSIMINFCNKCAVDEGLKSPY